MTFDFYMGGYFHNNSYRLILEGDKLSISAYAGIPVPEHAKTVSVHSNQDWAKLVEFLKKCKWDRRYDSEMLDGTQWELKAKDDGIKINSYGSNAYPDNFDEFLVLLNNVIKDTDINLVN